ncbi:aminoglycoside phosphotransferase family protein [Leptospira kanakyensis]|uniref:Aminoglycoside phosphotransferase family protein n=1 Tax=Leptospira kanakyensis TaxID=2484968 RepID=A0A6N4QDJ8_9LEPT|nr:aminoglycoside phosphotransferase family protein [Leptospira kanakyensis]MCW7469218.1 aminoglycoside phosphotransferase family protein [Leptospira kanakyensis]MCW7480207.1 aminoglycoside phosphotransferase family protein [Leptospira kanakyensis]TGK50410.1 aminoglycoside phosphotransferase family protein [Leptospira kanakyensis]TGK63988.1 aminoglycoside phosphotransferase family protein [Leptospira kanakyensis]TGK69548.1 aminoglycoside phosphotransferase family protein [Leptospira kanakyensi
MYPGLNNSQLDFIFSRNGKNCQIKPLQEEASTRRYFRLTLPNNSEEVVCVDENVNEDFIVISDFLNTNKIRVPRVLDIKREFGLTFMSFEGLDDFSTYKLNDYKNKFPILIDLILKLQSLDPPPLVKNRKFDTEKLSFETNLTLEKFEGFRKEFNIKTEISNEAKAFIEETVGYLNKYPINVFTHRDFHCRNLLISPNSDYALIDFQDARMGVPQYDLTSILYDAYYPLPRDFRILMLKSFQERNIDQSKKFKDTFYLQALQRSFKALGTYFRMVTDHKKEKFKPSIISCLNQLEEIIQLGMFADSLYIFVRSLREELSRHKDFKNL